MTRTQKFIKESSHLLESSPDFFNFDSALMRPELFYEKPVRMLLVLLSPSITKSVSATVNSINDMVIEMAPNTYLDIAYLPTKDDLKVLDNANLPYLIGHQTRLDASHFDIIGFSISVLHEIVTIPTVIKSLERCDTPVSLTWTERKNKPLGTTPLMLAGGITAAHSDLCFGHLGDGRQSFLDALILGIDEALLPIFNWYEEMNTKDNPHTIQDFIERCFESEHFYHPQAYDVVYEDNIIVSNIKINPKARDFVKPKYDKFFKKRLYSARTVVQGTGSNAGDTQVALSEGCTGGRGSCNFKVSGETYLHTPEGIKKIRDYKGNQVLGIEMENCVSVDRQADANLFRVTTRSGYHLDADRNHKFMVLNRSYKLRECVTEDLKPGDIVLLSIQDYDTGLHNERVEEAELIGFMHGDGSYTRELLNTRCQIYCNDGYEKERYFPLFRKYYGYEGEPRVHYSNEKTGTIIWTGSVTKSFEDWELPGSFYHVPEFVMEGSKKVKFAYLRGLFQADGWVDGGINLTSVNEKLIDQVMLILTSLGIRVTKRENKFNERNKDKFSDGYDRKNSFYIRIRKEFQHIFVQGVGNVGKFKDLPLEECVGNRTEGNVCVSDSLCDWVDNHWEGVKPNDIRNITKRSGELGRGISDFTIRKLRRLVGKPLPRDLELIASGLFSSDVISSVQDLGIVGDCWDVVETGTNLCVYNSILTHQCAEGNYTGSWVENPIENIKWSGIESKRYCAADSVKPLSFNVNHYSDFRELLYELKVIFPKVTFINMRMEELAKDIESWHMMEYLGASRLSCPIEGLSDRIRNGFMNKNLSKESVDFLFDRMIGQPISDLKVGLVWTAHENDEDWEEYYELMDRVKTKAAEMGKKMPVRLKACLTDSALTPVPGKGLQRQSQLRPGKVEGVKRTEILAYEPQGMADLLTITTHMGHEINGTYNHKVLVKPDPSDPSSWKMLSELTLGDKVLSRINTQAFGGLQSIPFRIGNNENLTIDLASLLGWHIGNSFYFTDSAIVYTFEEFDQELFWVLRNILSRYQIKFECSNSDNLFTLKVTDSDWIEFITYRFGDKGRAQSLDFYILNSPKVVQISFLKYFLASNASVEHYKESSVIKATVTSKQMALDIQAMLSNLGILSNINKISVLGDNFWRISIDTLLNPHFNQEVAIAGPLGRELLIPSNVEPLPDIIELTVVKVADGGRDLVYGIEVKDSHDYVTNGIISHNTPLVHYPGTAFWWTERKGTRISYNGERYLTEERWKKNRERDVHLRFNGFIGSTFIEQALVDLGRSITPWIYEHIVKENIVLYNTRPIKDDERYPSFKALITDEDKFFGERDVDTSITPMHRIRLSLEGGILTQAKKILDPDNSSEPTGKCLYTYDGCKTSCYTRGMNKAPYIYYSDVQRKVSHTGTHVIGKSPQVIKGCEYCETPEEMVQNHLKRPIFKKYDLDDIKATVFVRNPKKYRFVIRRSKTADVLNPNNTAYTSIAALLNHNDILLNEYWRIENHSFSRQSMPNLPWASYGIQIIDVVFKQDVDEAIKDTIPKANQWLRASRIETFFPIQLDEKIHIKDLNLFRFETTLPLELFQVAAPQYRGAIRVAKQDILEDVIDKSLTAPVTFSKGNTIGYFTLPVRYNPFLYLNSLLKVRRVTNKKLIETTSLESVLFLRESYSVCSCGKPALTSLVNNKTLKCAECTAKALSIMELNKK